MAKTPAELEAMGLPATFTPEDLRGSFSRAEIAAMSEGDDAIFDPADIPEDMKSAGKQPTAFEAAKGWVEPKVSDKDNSDDNAEDGDDGTGDDDSDGAAAGEGDDDGDDAGDAGEGQGEGGDGDDDGDDGDAKGKGKADADAAAEPALVLPETLNEPDPEVQWADTTELAKAIEGMDGQLIDLQARYDDGDLTSEQFREEQKKLIKDQAKAQADLDRATERNEQASTAINGTWDKKVAAFIEANPTFVDRTPIKGLPNGESAMDVFDGALKYVTANSAKMGVTTMADQIRVAAEMADRYVFTYGNKKLVAESKAKADDKKNEGERKGPRKDKRPEPPVTLHGKSAVSENAPNEDRFAYLDAIEDPIEHEKAVGKLSDADLKAYLGA